MLGKSSTNWAVLGSSYLFHTKNIVFCYLKLLHLLFYLASKNRNLVGCCATQTLGAGGRIILHGNSSVTVKREENIYMGISPRFQGWGEDVSQVSVGSTTVSVQWSDAWLLLITNQCQSHIWEILNIRICESVIYPIGRRKYRPFLLSRSNGREETKGNKC